jgi:hypothetical protein
MRGEDRGKMEEGRWKKRPDERLEAIPVVETLASLKGMVPRPKKKLSLEEMDEAITKGANR